MRRRRLVDQDIESFDDGVGVVWFEANALSQAEFAFTSQCARADMHSRMRAPIGHVRIPCARGRYFGVWHEIERGSRDGVHRIRWGASATLYLVNVRDSPRRALKPMGVTPLR